MYDWGYGERHTPYPPQKRYQDETADYRKGFVEGEAGEQDVYLLFTGCSDVDEYRRGFLDGLAKRGEACEE